MSVKAGAGNLSQAAKALSIEWQETRGHWRDQKAEQFERRYIDALPQQIAKTLSVMEDLDTVLRKIRRDCE